MKDHYQVLIVGGGTAGLTVASKLALLPNAPDMGLIEPSSKHYYQPLWTLVGAGVFDRSVTERDERDYVPAGVDWIQDRVDTFDPDNNTVTTASGNTISYDYLIVTAGIQIDWDAIPGLKESVGQPGTGVCSNYSWETVNSTWENIKSLKSGTAIFTQPSTGVKCAGAPQKICYLAEDHFRRSGVRNNINVKFVSGTGSIFGVKKYADSLNRVIDRKGIEAHYNTELVALRPDSKEAIFEPVGGGDQIVMKYDMIHVTPRQSAPDFIKKSKLAASTGWVDVDQHTTQHVRYPNVFSCGDSSSMPTSKTGAAIRKQAPVLVENLLAAMAGRPLTGHYDGYTSCPLVTGYGTLILAEFGYDKQPQETFPFDQSEERYSMYALKAHGLPRIYWHGMLRGRA
ncbi:MAG: NAD(P)/FAD-dependent oxidoreductase [Ardenticatenaceae bacterium]|nr:NAD(P)/FAD-dependent oxidoreductase [Ardenticatenaceae bacterium]MCB8946389.1 NAD(P)/FAD-dependent oxidoreductase [Ardenticatenaceae bacterium]